MVSNNIGPKYNVNALGQSQPNGVPMQALDTQQVKDAVDNSYMVNRVNASEESPYTLPLIAAGWAGLNYAGDKFNAACVGDMEHSLLGKAGAWGDKVTESVKSTKTGQVLIKFRDKVSNGITKLTGKSKVVHALKNYTTRPEWEMARFAHEGLNGFLSADIKQLFDYFLSPIDNPIKLEQFNVPKSEIDALTDSLKGLSADERAIALHKAELKALGVNPEQIEKLAQSKGLEGLEKLSKSKKLKALGFKNFKEYNIWKQEPYDNVQILKDAFDKTRQSGKDLKISVWRQEKCLGSKKLGAIVSQLKGRCVTLSELANKYDVVIGKSNAKSSLGKALQKSLGWGLEGFTGRFAGGKLIPLVFAFSLADGIVNTIKAPKGEHGKTLAERIINDFSYVFSMPLAVMAMHKIGGLKYAGMTDAEVKAYRDALTKYHADVKAGVYKNNKAGLKQAAKSVDGMLKKGFFQRIGRFLNIGNETTAIGAKRLMKNCVGVPLRVFLAMAVLSPFVAKTCTKLSHVIFGKPTKSILDEETDSEENDSIKPAEEVLTAQQKVQNNPFSSESIVHTSPTNLLNMHKNGQTYQSIHSTNSTTTNTVNNTVIPPKEQEDNRVLEPVRTYIPSPEGVKVQGEDTTAAEQAIARANAAERKAMEVLAMKF